MLAFGLHLTILLKSCEHLYAVLMIFVYILYAVYSVTLWERGNKLEFVFHLFVCSYHFMYFSESGHEYFPNCRQPTRDREETSTPDPLTRQGQKQDFY